MPGDRPIISGLSGQPVAVPCTYVGTLHDFVLGKDDWRVSKKRMTNFFLANEVLITTDATKKALFLNSLDKDAYSLVSSLSVPDEPEDKTFQELVGLLDSNFAPSESVITCRHRFQNAMRDSGESLQDWVARLRMLVAPCKYPGDVKEHILDQFILGMPKGRVKDRLFEEDRLKLSLERALEIAMAKESAATQYNLSEGTSVKPEPSESVNFIRKGRRDNSSSGVQRKACAVCGRNNHPTDRCFFKNATCDLCRVKGHIKRVCPTAPKGEPKVDGKPDLPSKENQVKANFLVEASDSDCEPLYNMKLSNSVQRPFVVEIFINDIPIEFEIDTGCSATILPFSVYKNHFHGCELLDTDKTFVSYFQNKARPVGLTELHVKFEGVDHGSMPLYVVSSAGPPLLGRDWFKKMGFSISLHRSADACFWSSEDAGQLFDKLKREFPKVFSSKLGRFTKGKISLDLKEGAKPKFIPARAVPYALRQGVEEELDRLVKEGVLVPVDFSNFGSPIVPVLKKGGKIRICGDYKVTINPIMQVDQHPLPTADTIFQKVQGCKVFAKMDLSSAYQQMELDEKSREYVTITTHKGLFTYTRLPFGVAPGPAKFQKQIDILLEGVDGAAALLDDFLVGGRDLAELEQRLRVVLTRLEEAGLTLSESKCEVGKSSVEYLGFRIDEQGIHSTDDKVRAIVEAPEPTNVKDLQSFLGFVSFLRKFLPDVTETLHPLYQLLRKTVAWDWDESCKKAFARIKEMVISSRSLAHYNPELPLRLVVDASCRGVGAVLLQREGSIDRPIAFASRSLSKAEEAYSMVHKESLAIIFAVNKFHIYLYGRGWTLISDHKPLLTIFGPKRGIPLCAANRLQRWSLILACYQFDIEYVSSRRNIADWLSRAPLPDVPKEQDDTKIQLQYIFDANSDLPLSFEDIVKETRKDLILLKAMNFSKDGWPEKAEEDLTPFWRRRSELHVVRDVLFLGYRIVIPRPLRGVVLQELHASHLGIVKVKSLARSYVWWPGMDHEIETLIKDCEACAYSKDHAPKPTLVPWEWPEKPWSRLHIDYLGPILNHYVLVIVDSHSKWIEAFATKGMTSEITITLLRQVFSRFGLPDLLVSDNYASFKSDSFQQFLRLNGVEFKSGAPMNPATNGAAENAVRSVKRSSTSLGKSGDPAKLELTLQRFLLDYRNSKHATTGLSPAEVLLKRQIRSRLDLLRPPAISKRVHSAQEKQIKHHGGIEPTLFSVGDTIWARNYRRNDPKWSKAVVQKILGPRRYEVLVPHLGLQWVRHVRQLRKRPDVQPPVGSVVTTTDRNSGAQEARTGLDDFEDDGPSDGASVASSTSEFLGFEDSPVDDALGTERHVRPIETQAQPIGPQVQYGHVTSRGRHVVPPRRLIEELD